MNHDICPVPIDAMYSPPESDSSSIIYGRRCTAANIYAKCSCCAKATIVLEHFNQTPLANKVRNENRNVRPYPKKLLRMALFNFFERKNNTNATRNQVVEETFET